MDDPPLNPSQHVERIREILVGRQLNQVEERLRVLEETAQARPEPINPGLVDRIRKSQITVLEETQQLRHQLQREHQLRTEQVDRLESQLEATCRDIERHDQQLQDSLSAHLENISSAMAARIDARVREILQHLQTELVQWKNQIDRDLHSLRDDAVSRAELKSRFSRLASAAMEDDPPKDDEFLV